MSAGNAVSLHNHKIGNRVANTLGFTCAFQMRRFARLLDGDRTPDDYGDRHGQLERAFRLYREAL
jgi:hypothetical protein